MNYRGEKYPDANLISSARIRHTKIPEKFIFFSVKACQKRAASAEEAVQLHETGRHLGAVGLHLTYDFFNRFGFVEPSRLGVELIGIAYHFLLNRERQHIEVGKGQILRDDVGRAQSGAGVALAYQGMARETFGAQHIGTDDAVAYVRFCSRTMYRRCIASDYAYIVEHRGALHKFTVGVDAAAVETFESLAGYTFAVNRERVSQLASGCVIFVDNSLVVSHFWGINCRGAPWCARSVCNAKQGHPREGAPAIGGKL